MTTTDLKNAIKTASFDRCLVFCGEEDYLKQHYLKELRKAVLTDESFSVFNHFKFEGEKINYKKLYDAVASPPMMSDFKLIEWHLANFDDMKESDLEDFSEFCKAKEDYPYSLVVFVSNENQFSLGKYPKNPSSLYNRINESASVVVFEYSTEAQLMSWIARHIEHEGLKSEPSACRAILDRVGRDMSSLSLEIEKFCAYAKQNKKTAVLEKDVLLVCSSGGENDAFGLTNALLSRNKKLAYENLLDLKRKKADVKMILGSVIKQYSEIFAVSGLLNAGLSASDISKKLRLHEYKTGLYIKYISTAPPKALEKMLSLCNEVDTVAKSFATLNAYTTLERLIAESI